MNTVVLTGGGTAGHIMPSVALMPELEKYFDKIVFMGGNGMEKDIAAAYKLDFRSTETVPFRRDGVLKNLAVPFKLCKGVNQAVRILKELTPSVVFSKGGYVSLPAVIAAKRLGIPVVCHESDFTLGLANKIAVKLGATCLVSFRQTAMQDRRYLYTGLPVRESIFNGNARKAQNELGFTKTGPVLLVVGGSSGSRALNECVTEALPLLTREYTVVHVLGNKNSTGVVRDRYYTVSYTDHIEDYYALADVVVSRAGAGALSELSALRKCVVFIPLPADASRGDQCLNADYAVKLGAVSLDQKDLTPQRLWDAVTLARKTPMTPASPVANALIVRHIARKARVLKQ